MCVPTKFEFFLRFGSDLLTHFQGFKSRGVFIFPCTYDTHKDVADMQFDQKKPTVATSNLSIMTSYFCSFFSFFFTNSNFCNYFFTIEGV
jgi:hypothetical protein